MPTVIQLWGLDSRSDISERSSAQSTNTVASIAAGGNQSSHQLVKPGHKELVLSKVTVKSSVFTTAEND